MNQFFHAHESETQGTSKQIERFIAESNPWVFEGLTTEFDALGRKLDALGTGFDTF